MRGRLGDTGCHDRIWPLVGVEGEFREAALSLLSLSWVIASTLLSLHLQ